MGNHYIEDKIISTSALDKNPNKSIVIPKVISFDYDMTLVNTLQSLKDFYIESVDKNAKIPNNLYTFDWGVFKDKKQHDDFIKSWTRSEHFTNIPMLGSYHNYYALLAGAKNVSSKEYLEALKRMGHTLYVVTSISNEPSVIARREHSIRRDFGSKLLKDIICLNLEESKTDTLKQIKADIHVDDSKKCIIEAKDAGAYPIHLANKQDQELERMGCCYTHWWGTVFEYIESLSRGKSVR